MSLFYMSVSLFLFCKQVHLNLCLRFYIHAIWCEICLWFTSFSMVISKSIHIAANGIQFSSVQFSRSVVSNSLRPHELQHSLFITNSRNPPKPMSIESVMPSNHLILCHPLLLLPSIFPSLFKWVSSSHQVAKVLEFHLQHQSFQWTPRTDLL